VYKESQGSSNYDVNRDASRQEMRSFTCAQCHVEYYFTKPDNQLVYPWHNGLLVEQQEAYYDDIGYYDWIHGITGAPMLKAQHPEFELWMQGIHARAGVSCADCHMPYRRVGAMKVSDHHVRSPLLDVAASCQTCHNVPEEELLHRRTPFRIARAP
jgi:nitrite reductase (cytochrome c-552)